jgi:hypothetical protein
MSEILSQCQALMKDKTFAEVLDGEMMFHKIVNVKLAPDDPQLVLVDICYECSKDDLIDPKTNGKKVYTHSFYTIKAKSEEGNWHGPVDTALVIQQL